MTLAITATPGALAGTVDLAVTGAATVGASKYASNFAAGVDSWAGGSGGSGTPTLTAPVVVAGASCLQIGAGADFFAADQYAKRTVGSLSIGQTYRVTATIRAGGVGSTIGYLGVAGIGTSDGQALIAGGAGWAHAIGAAVGFTYDFVATGTSHDIQVTRMAAVDSIHFFVTDVHVVLLTSGSLDPCVIERQDSNGSHFVRLLTGQDVDGSGNLTVTDYEPAITGTLAGHDITYLVRDGVGNTATTDTSLFDPASVPLLSSVGIGAVTTVARIDTYNETWEYAQRTTNVKAVIGKGDPIVQNSDDYSWSQREGTVTLYAARYSDARDIIATHTGARVVLLRQGDYPGLDLYYVATRVTTQPGTFIDTADGLLWTWPVSVDYIETGWPDGDLIGSESWTYNDLEASFLAYFDVNAHYASYADLAADNEI